MTSDTVTDTGTGQLRLPQGIWVSGVVVGGAQEMPSGQCALSWAHGGSLALTPPNPSEVITEEQMEVAQRG